MAVVRGSGSASAFMKDINDVKSYINGISYSTSTPGNYTEAMDVARRLFSTSDRYREGAKKVIISILNNGISKEPDDTFSASRVVNSLGSLGIEYISIGISTLNPPNDDPISGWLNYSDDYSYTHAGEPKHVNVSPRASSSCMGGVGGRLTPPTGDELYSNFKSVVSGSCPSWNTNGCINVVKNGSFDSMNNWLVVKNDGAVTIHGTSNKLLHMIYSNAPTGEEAIEIPPVAPTPVSPGSPYVPMVPAVPAIPAIPSVDAELECTNIIQDIRIKEFWAVTKNTGYSLSYINVDGENVLRLRYAGVGVRPETTEHELVKSGKLDGNYSGWYIEKTDGIIDFPTTDLVRRCDNNSVTDSVAMDLSLNDCDCDDAGIEDTCT